MELVELPAVAHNIVGCYYGYLLPSITCPKALQYDKYVDERYRYVWQRLNFVLNIVNLTGSYKTLGHTGLPPADNNYDTVNVCISNVTQSHGDTSDRSLMDLLHLIH